MNILYVSGMAGPLISVIKGEEGIKGLPAFYYPWKMLVERGHTVDFVVTSNFNEPYNIKVDWFSEKNIIKNIYAPHKEVGRFRIFRKINRFLQLLYYTNKAVRKKKYDFIYCKAFEGVAGQIIANIYHIPHCVRSFGDHMWTEIKRYGAKKAALKNPLEYLCYQLDCSFFLMSEDHKDQIITYNSWHNPRNHYPFYLWPSGIQFKELSDCVSTVKIPNEPYLFFPGRLDPIKRQDRVIKVLKELHNMGVHMHLYFCGSNDSQKWRDQLDEQIEDLHLKDYVHFLGPIPQDDLKILAFNAVANILMIDGSSRNNVFYEILSVGSIVVGLDDGGINDYIVDGESGFLVKDECNAATVVAKLMESPDLMENIHKNACKIAKKKVMSIEERFGKEVDLIERVSRGEKL